MNRAEIVIPCEDPKIVIDSLEPEMEKLEKFNAEVRAEGGGIRLVVEADEISGLLAGINSYIRLIRASIDVKKIGE